MKLFGKYHLIFSAITFVVIFLMNYLGNEQDDKLSRALLNSVAAVVGLTAGMFILYKNKDDKNPPESFD